MADQDATEDLGALTTALNEILGAFKKVKPADRERLLTTVATFLKIGFSNSATFTVPTTHHPDQRGGAASSGGAAISFSEDRSISPKDFLLQKQPRTDVEKVACLAYYLTNYRGIQHFRTVDLSKVNTEAAQRKFANSTWAVNNALKMGYLVPVARGQKQLSAVGEQFVNALPDRDAAKSVMANARPRKRARRTASADKKMGPTDGRETEA
jgi:hypothetical protein